MALVPLGFRMKDRPGFEDVEFSSASQGYLVWPEAVKFAAAQGDRFVLQSAREAVAFRVEANGQDGANLYQATRTAAIYGLLDGKLAVAFDEDPDPTKNLVLQSRLGVFSKKDVSDVLTRAEKAGRIVEVKENPLERSVKSDGSGRSAYGQDPLVKAALLGMAEENARFIAQKYNIGRVYPVSGIEQLGLDQVDVRAVGLGGGLDGLDAVNLLDDYGGRARGVRRVDAKKSP